MEEKQLALITDKLLKLDGMVLALTAALQSIILESPDPKGVAERARARVEKLFAEGLGHGVSDSFVEGIRQGSQQLFQRQHDRPL